MDVREHGLPHPTVRRHVAQRRLDEHTDDVGEGECVVARLCGNGEHTGG